MRAILAPQTEAQLLHRVSVFDHESYKESYRLGRSAGESVGILSSWDLLFQCLTTVSIERRAGTFPHSGREQRPGQSLSGRIQGHYQSKLSEGAGEVSAVHFISVVSLQ